MQSIIRFHRNIMGHSFDLGGLLPKSFWIFIFLIMSYYQAQAQSPGMLDATFGTGGIVTTGVGSGNDGGRAVVIQADGKIIVGGYTNAGATNWDFALIRYNSNGSLDNSFGTNGKVVSSMGNGDDGISAVLIQPDKKIVVVGDADTTALAAGKFVIALARYDTTGALDVTFGTGGKVFTAVGTVNDRGNAAALQSDGKIVVAGRYTSGTSDVSSARDIVVVRYNNDGSLDTGFGTGGKVTTPIGSGADEAKGIVLQSNGKIVVCGSTSNGLPPEDIVLVRYNANGTLDTGFGTGGSVITTIGTSEEGALQIRLQTNGKIVMAAYTDVGSGDLDMAVLRYDTTGALDATFGTGGKVVTSFGTGFDAPTQCLIQTDGKIVAAGETHNGSSFDFAMARYTSSGALDASFGTGGKATTAIGTGDDEAFGAALQTDGKIVLAGESSNGTNGDFAIVRYLGGSLPPPTITSFSPTSGPISTSVTITGNNFSTTAANNIVFFGAVRAAVTSASSTSLTVTVPTGATYQPITITVNGLTAYSSVPFTVTFPSSQVLDPPSYLAKVDFTTGTQPGIVAIGDVDGDGKPDLVTSNNGSNSVSVFRNTSSSGSITSGSFAAKVDFTTATNPQSIAIGDLDGDGKPDLVATNFSSNSVSLFRNISSSGSITSGSFEAKVDFPTGTGPRGLAIGDLDGDGKPDLAVANINSNSVSLFRNTSSAGSFTSGSLAAKVDFATGSSPYQLTIGDIDGDGKPEVVVTNVGSTSVSVFRNTTSPGSITTGSFAAKVDFATGTTPYVVAIGDLDGDGKADLAIVNQSSNTVSIFRNTSSPGSITSGSFAAKVDFATGNTPNSVAIGDLDGDSKPDLAVANMNNNTFSLFRNTSSSGSMTTGSFAAKVDYTTGTQPACVAIGDLDGEGKPELTVTNLSSNTVSIYRNNLHPITPPQNLAVTDSSIGSITIKWRMNTELDFLRYRIYRGTSPNPVTRVDSTAGGNVSDTSKTFTGLANGTRYYIRVTAVDSALNESGYSNEVNALPADRIAPSAPISLVVTDSSSRTIAIKWRKNTEIDFLRYRIYRGTSANPTTKVDSTIGGSTDTSKTLTGLTNGTRYYIRVTAVDSSGNESGYSNEVNAAPADRIAPSAPISLVVTDSSSRTIAIKWRKNTETDFLRYRIYRGTSANPVTKVDSTAGGNLSDTSKTFTGLTNGTRYYFRVTAVDSAGNESGYSNEVDAAPADRTAPSAPISLVVTDSSSATIAIKWRKNTEPDFLRYRVFRGTSPSPTTKVDSTTAGISDTSKAFTSLTNGTRYYFRVTAVDSTGNESGYSNEVNAAPADRLAPSAPVSLVVTDSSSRTLTVKWRKNAEPDFLRYRIYRGTSPGPTTKVDSTAAGIADTTRTFTGLTNGTRYYLRVTAVDSAGNESAYSNEVNAVPADRTAPATPQALAVVDSSSTKIGIKWKKNTEADFLRYRIYRGTTPAPTTKVDSTTGGVSDTSKTFTGLTNGTRYYLRVTALDSAGNESGYSNEVNGAPNAGILSNPIPNFGFENWTSGKPDSWVSIFDELLGVTTIAQTNDVHSGSWALKGFVAPGNIPPVLTSEGFPTGARFATLLGYYKFTSVSSDSIVIVVSMVKNGQTIGAGILSSQTNVGTYTQFNIPISYSSGAIPDSGQITVILSNKDSVRMGTTFYLDDLSFGPVTAVHQELATIPTGYTLFQNYPNPFNPSTIIRYGLPERSRVTLQIYDLLGRVVATLVDGEQEARFYEVSWQANVPSGIYFYRIVATAVNDPSKSFVQVRKMLLLK